MWDPVEDKAAVTDILAVCARLRLGFELDWIATWALPDAVQTFRLRLLYLFRQHHDGWRFFHDSFRQFAADRTSLGVSGQLDQVTDEGVHRHAADLCAAAPLPSLRDEEFYHRWCSGDDDAVLHLAQPEMFRAQSARFRPADLIRSDIAVALRAAATRADIVAVLRLLLCLAELRTRSEMLDDVDMPAVLYAAGLVDEAIGYCGVETRRVPLAQAYALAAALGRAGDPAGRAFSTSSSTTASMTMIIALQAPKTPLPANGAAPPRCSARCIKSLPQSNTSLLTPVMVTTPMPGAVAACAFRR